MCKQSPLRKGKALGKLRGEPAIIGMADLKPIRCAIRSTPVEWQTDRFIQNESCEAVW